MGETTNAGDIGATDADASKGIAPAKSPTPTPSAAIPAADEPRILEEHIVTPAPKAPSPAEPAPDVRPTYAPEAVKVDRVDLSKPGPFSQPKPSTPSVPAPEKLANVAAPFKNEQDDISKILGGVKLPERPGTTQKVAPQKTYDTSLAVDPATQATDRAEKQARVRDAARAVTESLPSEMKHTDDVRPLHTLKDDLQDVVRNKKISLVRAVALEEDKKHRPSITAEEELAHAKQGRRTTFPVALTFILFLVGAGALGGAYFILQNRTIETAPITSHVLFAEQTVPFPIEGLAPADLRREIASARNAGTLTLGAILQIIPAHQSAEGMEPIPFGDFMNSIGAKPPDELVRALSGEFFFGIHTVDENAPVFVIPVESYERAFAGMLAWERTINADLAPITTAVSMQTVSPEGVIVERKFEDTVIRNYDVRVLKDEAGIIQLYYSFPTRNILIIAESQYSFTELLARLRADRRL
ncbi:MAG: hypothetical protein WA021_04160 [Minisyncoccia bacterium]